MRRRETEEKKNEFPLSVLIFNERKEETAAKGVERDGENELFKCFQQKDIIAPSETIKNT